MIVVVITCVVVIVVLLVVLFRLRDDMDQLRAIAQAMVEERDAARLETAAAHDATERLRTERDEALERVQRAKRDAAEVANRLSSETSARSDVEEELRAAHAELEEARAAGRGGLADLLWSLTIRQSETTWRRSIAVDPDAASPFDGVGDVFRVAVEIEADAAREESGAALDVVWAGEAEVPAERAVVVVAALRAVIDSVSTVAAQTTVTIDCREDAVELSVDSVDDAGEPIVVGLPAPIECGAGRARVA